MKKSASLSCVFTNGTTISCDSTMSRMKKCRRATCLERPWCSGLYDKSRAALLSVDRTVGSEPMDGTKPRTNFRRCTTSLAASDNAIISDSQEESATDFCFLEPQQRGAPCQYMIHPEVDARTSHEASAVPRRVPSSGTNRMPTITLSARYENTYSSFGHQLGSRTRETPAMLVNRVC